MPPSGRLLSLVVLLVRATWSVVRAADDAPPGLDTWKESVRQRFPEVPQLSTAHLAEWLRSTNRPAPLLLDVRTPAEYAVSHLPQARQVDPDLKAPRLLDEIPADRPVVVYCSVGWRSSELARRLRKAGRTNVMNLEGSIFAWANEDRPLESDGGTADRVHPYNRTFGKLLKPERRAAPDARP